MAKTNDHVFTDKLGVPWQVVREDVINPNPGLFQVPGVSTVRRYWALAPFYYAEGPGKSSQQTHGVFTKGSILLGPSDTVSQIDTWIADWVYQYRVATGDLAPKKLEGGGFIVAALVLLVILQGKR